MISRSDWPTLGAPYRRLMAQLGLMVGRRPLPFLVIPLLVSASLAYSFVSGMADYRRLAISRAGSIQLFTPSGSRSEEDRWLISQAFPDGGYFRDRTVVSPGLFVVLVGAADRGDTILRDEFVNEYRRLRQMIENLTVFDPRSRSKVTLRSVCADESKPVMDWSGCQSDAFLTLWTFHRSGLLRKFTYPYVELGGLASTAELPAQMYIGPLLGGVRTDSEGSVVHCSYVRMIFHFPASIDEILLNNLAEVFDSYVSNHRSDLLRATYWLSQKYTLDMRLISKRVIRLLPALILLLLLFALASCCMRDPVLSKPWLAVAGLLSAALGLQIGFAVLFILNVQLIEIAMIVPFLVLSIGLDDTFVMLNVWRSTDPKLSVEARISRTYAEAAVSITITSVTDVAAFLIGICSVFPAVRIFCAFCASSLFFVSVTQMTFFGACMTYTGRIEAEGRHSVTFRKIPVKTEKESSDGFRWTCLKESSQQESTGDRRPWPVKFFRHQFAVWLRSPRVKLAVAISYVAYIGGAVFFLIAFLKQGLQVSNLVPYDSATYDYLILYEKFFSKSSTAAEVLLLPDPTYRCGSADGDALSDFRRPEVQQLLVEFATTFENTEFSYRVDFWLRQLASDRKRRAEQSLSSSSTPSGDDWLTTEAERIDAFLTEERHRKYAQHVSFDRCPDGDRFVNASRFYVQLANVDMERRSKAMRLLRQKAESAPPGFRALVYDVSFPLAEQYDAVLPGVLYDVAVGVGCMLITAALFVPHWLVCLCIAFTVFSINIGVLGYLAVWQVNLDIISTIAVLLSIGFSVDYTSHVAYHFHVAVSRCVDDRVAEALETAGWPILQSGLSMLVGVVTVLGVRAYISDTFVKTLFLVIVIGVYHALVVLPVMLSVAVDNGGQSNSVDSLRSRSSTGSSSDQDRGDKSDEEQGERPNESDVCSSSTTSVSASATSIQFRQFPASVEQQQQHRQQPQSIDSDVLNHQSVYPLPAHNTLPLSVEQFWKDWMLMSRDQESSEIPPPPESPSTLDGSRLSEMDDWLHRWIHGDVRCSALDGNYCAYCQMIESTSKRYHHHLLTSWRRLTLGMHHSCNL